MKKKFEIYRNAGFISDDIIQKETIKTFKNESDAVAFYKNPRNQRRYGVYSMDKRDSDGSLYTWDEHTESWQSQNRGA